MTSRFWKLLVSALVLLFVVGWTIVTRNGNGAEVLVAVMAGAAGLTLGELVYDAPWWKVVDPPEGQG